MGGGTGGGLWVLGAVLPFEGMQFHSTLTQMNVYADKVGKIFFFCLFFTWLFYSFIPVFLYYYYNVLNFVYF